MYTVNMASPAHAVAVIRALIKEKSGRPASLTQLGLIGLDGLAAELGIGADEEKRAALEIMAQLEETF